MEEHEQEIEKARMREEALRCQLQEEHKQVAEKRKPKPQSPNPKP